MIFSKNIWYYITVWKLFALKMVLEDIDPLLIMFIIIIF